MLQFFVIDDLITTIIKIHQMFVDSPKHVVLTEIFNLYIFVQENLTNTYQVSQ